MNNKIAPNNGIGYEGIGSKYSDELQWKPLVVIACFAFALYIVLTDVVPTQ